VLSVGDMGRMRLSKGYAWLAGRSGRDTYMDVK